MFSKKKQDDDITSLITNGKVRSKPTTTEQPQQQEIKKQVSELKADTLVWFNSVSFDDYGFLAIKNAANNAYEADNAHGQPVYKKHLPQLGEIGKTPFGQAMFYTGFTIFGVLNNDGADEVAAILPAFMIIFDWIEKQPNAAELMEYMGIPLSIINNASPQKRTAIFDDMFNKVIKDMQSRYTKLTQDPNITEALGAMKNLIKNLEQMPGIDPKDLAELKKGLMD